MSFPKYAEYVDSGVEWLEEVPLHWKTDKFRYVFNESNEKIEKTVIGEMLSVSGYRGIEIKTYDDDNKRRSEEELFGYRVVRPGQLVVNTMWLNYSGLGVSSHEGHVSPAYRSYWIKSDVDKRYIHHLMRSSTYVQGYTQLLTGIRPNSLQMSRDDLMGFPVLLPPKIEQTQIARFLDHETAKIDALIAEQKRLIKLLQEKRQAVISHAVTKGLDPNVPMKDSGVEWLGEVPAHWEVRKLKYCASLVTTKGASRENVISLENIEGGTGRFISTVSEFSGEGVIFEPQDVLFGKLRPYLAKVHLARTSGIALGDILVFRATEEFAPEFLFFMLISQGFIDEVNQSSYGTKMPRANPEYILGLFVTAPPREEQLEIANYLVNAQYDKILPTILNANRLMKLLEERRSALISAAVTGKIDVRDWQPPADENAFDEEVQKAGLEASA